MGAPAWRPGFLGRSALAPAVDRSLRSIMPARRGHRQSAPPRPFRSCWRAVRVRMAHCSTGTTEVACVPPTVHRRSTREGGSRTGDPAVRTARLPVFPADRLPSRPRRRLDGLGTIGPGRRRSRVLLADQAVMPVSQGESVLGTALGSASAIPAGRSVEWWLVIFRRDDSAAEVVAVPARSSLRVDPGGGQELGITILGEPDHPLAAVDDAVMVVAQEHSVVQGGLSAVCPVSNVMPGAPTGRTITPRKDAATVA